MRTVISAKMCGARVWVAFASLQLLLLAADGVRHHRRSMPTQATLPVSKGGWRPVIGSGGLVYAGSYGGSQLHSPAYKLPHPLDLYQSSSRPLVARDTAKLTSIAQSYRPTTLRTVNTAQPAPPANQPISSYHNPFYSNGLSYKYIQNFPVESVLIRNPQNPYAARPVYKYPGKIKQSLQNTVLQQLTNVQPIQFGQYQTSKPIEYAKPVEGYARPDSKHGQHSVETFKPEVFKLPDSETAPQQVSQHQVKGTQQQHHQVKGSQQQQQQQQPVKTAQQQQALVGTQKAPLLNHYAHYPYQDSVFPSSILGTFGSFGLQTVKGRDPVFPSRTTYLAPQPTKQTIFNSFSYVPTFKTTPTIQWQTTTPKVQTTANNHIQFGSTFTEYKTVPTQPTKPASSVKIDPNVNKGSFKASPQDPFIKNYQSDYNKLTVTTYNPVLATTLASNHYDYSFPPQPSSQVQKYYDQQPQNYNYQKKKQKIHHDSIAAGVNQATHQYASPPKSRPTYEVFETTDSEDIITQSSPGGWIHQSYDNPKTTEQTVTKQLYPDTGFSKQTTTPVADLTEEYAIVTEAEKGYGNSLGYDSEVESQSRRPLGDDFEPIGKHKLKDYYYKVSTPAYDDYTTTKRTKKPSESSRLTTPPEVSTFNINKETLDDVTLTPLPTLPPTQHFKRPTTTEPTTVIDKDRIRKRNKNRRRRPPLANINKDGTSTRKYYTSTTEIPQTTSSEEYHTIRPRIRPAKLKQQPNLTTPSVTTDLTTSAVPTISPTAPTIIKKKLVRRPLTTISDRIETTTQLSFKDYDGNKDSSIMKIATRPFPKLTASADFPDYSHKQDEKDTPTSDVSVSLTDSIKTSAEAAKSFAFHKDVKPIEAKLETTTASYGSTDVTDSTTTNRNTDTTSSGNFGKGQRPRLKNKYNRTRFSVKDYRNRLSSTTSSTERSTESTPKIRFPVRKTTTENNGESETTTERKKFTPKDPRHKLGNGAELNDEAEKEIHSTRHSGRQRQTTVTDNTEPTTQKISSRIRNGQRRPKPTEETPETTSPTTPHSKRPLRKKLTDSELGESVQDISVTETTVNYEHKNDITSERTRSESAIMKIADKKHHDHHIEHLFEHSKRVSDLTLAASKDYNTPGMFKTVSSNSRRIPNYFTIATDDPILPIEAFFPQLNQKKES